MKLYSHPPSSNSTGRLALRRKCRPRPNGSCATPLTTSRCGRSDAESTLVGRGSCELRKDSASSVFDHVYASDATRLLLYRLVTFTWSESYQSLPTDSCASSTWPNCG